MRKNNNCLPARLFKTRRTITWKWNFKLNSTLNKNIVMSRRAQLNMRICRKVSPFRVVNGVFIICKNSIDAHMGPQFFLKICMKVVEEYITFFRLTWDKWWIGIIFTLHLHYAPVPRKRCLFYFWHCMHVASAKPRAETYSV